LKATIGEKSETVRRAQPISCLDAVWHERS